jgi:hypothetical protein
MTSTNSKKGDGFFEFRDLGKGRYQLVGFKGMASKPVRVDLGEAETKDGIKLVLPSEVYVTGRVIRSDSGKGVPGVGIQYQGLLGSDTVLSDEEGRFAFQTLAVDSYTVRVHERGLVPSDDKQSTSVREVITRQIDPGASSDELIIKLKPVRFISGTVRGTTKDGKEGRGVWNAEIFTSLETQGEIVTLYSRSDTSGYFFVNLPEENRGYARLIARKAKQLAVGETRVPGRRPVRLQLTGKGLRGELYLVDNTPLSGVMVGSNYLYTQPAQFSKLLNLRADRTMTGLYGGFVLPLAAKQQVELSFRLPDGQEVKKTYSSDALSRKRYVFVYDPLTKDVMSDVRDAPQRRGTPPQQGGGQGGRRADGDIWGGVRQ